MTRDPNALPAYLEGRETWAFGYTRDPQTHDCVRFVGAGVEAVTGCNPLDHFDGEWTTRRGARRVLAKHGGMAKAVSEVMTQIPVTMAQRGDAALMADSALGLVEGAWIVTLSEDGRHVRHPRSAMLKAWTV